MQEQEKGFLAFARTHKWMIWLLILFMTLLWGYAWIGMKAGLDYMGPFTFSAFRFGSGALAMLLFVFVAKMGFPPKQYWLPLILLGLMQTTIVFALVMYGLRFVGAGESSVLLYSMPMWSSLLAAKYLGEKITPARFFGLLLGMLGLCVIIGWDVIKSFSIHMLVGELFITIAAVFWAISNIYYRKRFQALPQLQVNAFQMLFGAVGFVILAFIMEAEQAVTLNMTSWYYILFTGVCASAIGFTLYFVILSLVDMVTATISTLLVPIFGLFFSTILLGEKLTTGIVIGSLFIIAGIIIAQINQKPPRKV